MTIDPLQVYVPLTGLVNLSTTPHLRALRLDTICGDKQALADLDSVLNTVQPLHKIVKMRITLHMSDHTPLSPVDALDAGCTMLDPMMTKLLRQGKPMSFELHFVFPGRPSRLLLSRRKRALAEMSDMDKSEFSQMVLSKIPLTAMSPRVTTTIIQQKDRIPKGALRTFLRKIKELVRER